MNRHKWPSCPSCHVSNLSSDRHLGPRFESHLGLQQYQSLRVKTNYSNSRAPGYLLSLIEPSDAIVLKIVTQS